MNRNIAPEVRQANRVLAYLRLKEQSRGFLYPTEEAQRREAQRVIRFAAA